MKIFPIALAATVVCVSVALQSQPAFPSADEEVRVVAARPAVYRALTIAQELDAVSENELIELTEIPAPPFGEQARARRYADLLLAADHIPRNALVLPILHRAVGATPVGGRVGQIGRMTAGDVGVEIYA